MQRRFSGFIAGVGSVGGLRLVVGWWLTSPFGGFADVMVQFPDTARRRGHRLLLAPSPEVREFVSQTYQFDETRCESIEVAAGPEQLQVRSASVTLDLRIGGRRPLGRLLRLVPEPIATSPAWCTITDPIARLALRGVRTRGTAGNARREYYCARDLRAVTALTGRLDGRRLGPLAPVDPPCDFGFSSTPRRPSLTSVVTIVEV